MSRLPLVITTLGISLTATLSSVSASAVSSGEAYALCKQAAIASHGDGTRVSLKKVKNRASRTEVRIKVRADGESFRADCTIENEAVSTYVAENSAATTTVAANQ